MFDWEEQYLFWDPASSKHKTTRYGRCLGGLVPLDPLATLIPAKYTGVLFHPTFFSQHRCYSVDNNTCKFLKYTPKEELYNC